MKEKTINILGVIGLICFILFLFGGCMYISEPEDHLEITNEGAKDLRQCKIDFCEEKGMESDLEPPKEGYIYSWNTRIHCYDNEGEEHTYDFGTEIYEMCNVELRTTTIGKIKNLFKGEEEKESCPIELEKPVVECEIKPFGSDITSIRCEYYEGYYQGFPCISGKYDVYAVIEWNFKNREGTLEDFKENVTNHYEEGFDKEIDINFRVIE